MSYNNIKNRNVSIIELRNSTDQSVSAGNAVLFDTLKGDGSHGVSVDASGNITLNTGREYWIQASFDVDRSATTDSWAFDFYNASTGTVLGVSDGAFQAQWDYGSSSTKTNATFTAAYVSTAPLSSIVLKATTMTNTSTVSTYTRIIIIEVS
jgi:hypothetical protein